MSISKKMLDYIRSEEGQDDLNEYFDKILKKKIIFESQIERLHTSGRFTYILEKAIIKYDSNEYIDKWYKRGIEPPDFWFYFLMEYAEKYGRECDNDEWQVYSNTFTKSLIFCEGYYFNLMLGQGSAILVTKQ